MNSAFNSLVENSGTGRGMRVLAFVVAVLIAGPASAATIEGHVVGVHDGDSITVIDADRVQHRIRLAGIDAPELKQAFCARSKQNLSDMAFDKDVRVEWGKRDRYKRIVGKVWVQPADCPTCGMTLDAGHAQVIAGLAWWYRAYAKEQSDDDQGRYESAEDEARLLKWGLGDQRLCDSRQNFDEQRRFGPILGSGITPCTKYRTRMGCVAEVRCWRADFRGGSRCNDTSSG